MNRITPVTLSLLLTACIPAGDTQDVFQEYQNRVANITESELLPADDSEPPALPRKRSLTLPVEDIRVGLLDAYELHECGLFQHIAERNSVLGKIQDDFQLLDYEMTFLENIQRCITELHNEDLKTQLLSIATRKKALFPVRYWNAVGATDAWQKQLKVPKTMLPIEDAPPHAGALTAISTFATISPENTFEPGSIKALQQSIETQHYAGTLFYSMHRTTQLLEAITRQLRESDDQIACGQNRNQTKAEYLSNVFFKYYAGPIQPYLARLDSMYRDLAPPLRKIVSNTSPPDAFTPYRQYYIEGGMYTAFRKAIDGHVEYWQQLFKRCNIKIGAARG